MTRCKHCGDTMARFKCDKCKRIIIGECHECHAELKHGIIEPPSQEDKGGLPPAGWLAEKQYHGENSTDNR